MKTKLIIFVLLVSYNINGQSFFITETNDTIVCENISISKKILKYSSLNTQNDAQIELKKVNGYYAERENAFFQKNQFSIRTGFLGLGKELKDTQDFSELIIEGKIKAYRGRDFAVETAGGTPQKLNDWFLEKDSLFEKAFTADYDSGSLRLDGASFGLLNLDFFTDLVSDDKIAIEDLEKIKKKHGALNQILKIINDYNSRDFKHNSETSDALTKDDTAYITVFRDFGKELKDLLHITVNGIDYHLERNSKIELKIPTKLKSQICIENSLNKNCMIVSSSDLIPKYYRLKLSKKKKGAIIKVNGHSSYYKTRLEYYSKRAEK
ncbi:MAG: hypothetical protein ABJO28_16805 [Maribacter dokdonensis]|uniref:hypothetical protein n=2 Tax=Maribacter dokdonensis TaxID=320912 RepID=UPI00326728BA